MKKLNKKHIKLFSLIFAIFMILGLGYGYSKISFPKIIATHAKTETPILKVVPLNARYAPVYVNGALDHYELRAYDGDGTHQIWFRVLVTNYTESDVLSQDVTFSYRTYDLTAVGKSDRFNEEGEYDYVPVSGTTKFAKNTVVSKNGLYIDIPVSVYDCDYATFKTADYTGYKLYDVYYNTSKPKENSYTKFSYGINTSVSNPETASDTVASSTYASGQYNTAPSQTGYNGNYFGFEIYDVKNGIVSTSANNTTGINSTLNKAKGAVPAKSYLPIHYYNGNLQIAYWTSQVTLYTDDITLKYWDNKDNCVTKFYLDNYDFTKEVRENAMELGNWYTAWVFRTDCKNTETYTKYNYYALGTDTYANDIWISAANMDSFGTGSSRGVFELEVKNIPDAYGFGTGLNTRGTVRITNTKNSTDPVVKTDIYEQGRLDLSDYMYDTATHAWLGGDTYVYDEAEYYTNYHSIYDGESVSKNWFWVTEAYRTGGNPEYFSVYAAKSTSSGNRHIKNNSIYLFPTDDTPPEIKSIYVEDTEQVTKTKDDQLRIIMKLSEPIHFSDANKTKKFQLYCRTGSGTQMIFDYAEGEGTDTLVFSYDLKNFEKEEVITKIKVESITNPSSLVDFSSILKTYVQNESSVSGNHASRDSRRTWNLTDSYFNKEVIAAKNSDPEYVEINKMYDLTESIDTRHPSVNDVYAAGAITPARTHDVTIELSHDDMEGKVYVYWTEDMNLLTTDKECIPSPVYTEVNSFDISNGQITTSASLHGVRYLWFKVVSKYNKVEERVCGPFYFDSEQDTVTNIQTSDAYGNVSENFKSASKTKYIQFDVEHTYDYKSCAGQDLYDFDYENLIGLSNVIMIYSKDNVWGTDTEYNEITLYIDSNPNVRGLMVVGETVTDYVYEFGIYDQNLAGKNTKVTTSSFIVQNDDGTNKTKQYYTKRTYRVLIGYIEIDKGEGLEVEYNDFDIAVGDTADNFIGFIVNDGLNDLKDYSGKQTLTKEVEYISSVPLTISTIDIIQPTVTYSLNGNPNYDVLANTKNNQKEIDSSIEAYSLKNSETMTIAVDFTDYDSVSATGIENGTYRFRIKVTKPNGSIGSYTLKEVVETIGGSSEIKTEKFADDVFTGVPYYDTTKPSETPWFSWEFKNKKIISGEERYTQILITTKMPKDCADLSGYYTVQFDLLNYTNVFTLESKTVRPFSFYIGNGTNDTENITNINNGKLLINKVYTIDEGVKYYWFDTGKGIHEEYYSPVGTQLYFSSITAAETYLRYMETQDLDLYVIKTDNDAIALNQGSGEYYRAACDMDHTPQKGEIWIRYKAATWSVGNKEKSSWVYYYYTNVTTTTKINLGNLPEGLNDAIGSVVNTILKGYSSDKNAEAKTIMLTSKFGLDSNGSPYLNPECIKPDILSATKTKTNVEYVSPLNYSGDKKIYNATVSINDGAQTTSYIMSTNTKLSFDNKNNVYITPCFGEYQGYYGKCSNSSTLTLKDYVDEIYQQIAVMFDQEGGSVTAPSGVYKVMEIDDKGINYAYVYIDKSAPQINFSYNTWSTNSEGIISEVESIQHSINSSSVDRTINATSMTITGLGTLGVFDGNNADEEIDKYAYIAVFDTSLTTLYTAKLASELAVNPLVLDDDGTYRIQVYDRSGNNYELTVNICTVEMEVSVYVDNNVIVKIENRDSTQIKEFIIKKDNVTIDTLFEDSKFYDESGNYSIHIVDKFGISYNYTFEFRRKAPEITWLVEDGSGYSIVNETSSLGYITQKSDTVYDVVTSQKIAFKYDYGDSIGVKFYKESDKDNFSVIERSDVLYTQIEPKAFKVTFYYLEHTNVTITYNVTYDQTGPTINVGYDYYKFDGKESSDMMYTIEQDLAGEKKIINGQIISPTRLDYSVDNIQRINISTGTIINTKKVYLDFSDDNDISTIKIELDGTTLYEGDYQESGIYYNSHGELIDNFNILKEYGLYKIYAYDRLGNSSSFEFENSSNYGISYYVDGEEVLPVIDYIYKTDSNGNIIVDENNQKIVQEEWLYVTKFIEIAKDEENKSAYYIPKTNYSSVQYGNQNQTIRILQDSYIEYLVTDATSGENYFIGIRYQNGELYLYRYYAEYSIDDDFLDFGIEMREEYAPIYSKETYLNTSTSTIYTFSELGLYIEASFTTSDYLELKLYSAPDPAVIAICQTRVSSIEGVYEPAFFKTVLSQKEITVEINNGYKVVNEGDFGVNEWIYVNGEGLFIDESSVNEYVKDIYLAYSTSMSFNDFKYVYSINKKEFTEEELINLWYDNTFEDGYYCFRVDNLFGSSKYYYFILSNNIFVTTLATYEDGMEIEFSTSHTSEINCNGSVSVSFKEDNLMDVTLTKDNASANVVKTNENGGWYYTFSDEGHYVLTITDEFGNVVVRNITISRQNLVLPTDIITGLNQNALKANEKYSNTKGSINSYYLDNSTNENSIQYVEISCGGYSVVLYDQISDYKNRVAFNKDAFIDCIGELGDGVYTITFRDGYGNKKVETVYYRESSTLVLTRVTSTSQYEEYYSIEDALNPEINFISNKDLIFKTLSNECVFTINGEIYDLNKNNKTLSFSNSANEGRISYVITYKDEYGFVYTFNAILYRTVLYVTIENADDVCVINDTNVIKKNFKIMYSPSSTCTYTINGGESKIYTEGTYLKADGNYVFNVKDLAGNSAYYAITKDTVVYFSFNEGSTGSTIENGLVTSSNQINFISENDDDAFIKLAFVDGESIDVSGIIDYTINGKWEFIIEDKFGNQASFMYIHITHEIKSFDYYLPQNFEFTNIWLETANVGKVTCNQEVITDKNGRKHFQFKEEGTYSIIITSVTTNESYNFVITISHKKPTATLSGVEDGGVTIKDVEIVNTLAGDTINVYKNSKLVSTYTISNDNEKVTISEEGNYTINIKNIAGNEVTYSFIKKHVANTAGSVLIVVSLSVLVIGLFIALVYRKRSKVDK